MASHRWSMNPKVFELVGWNQGLVPTGFAKSDQVLDWVPAHEHAHHPESPLCAGTHGIDIDSPPGHHLGAEPWHVLVEDAH